VARGAHTTFRLGLPANSAGAGGLPVNIFANPTAAFNDFRNPILGLDKRDYGFGSLIGLPYWNLDFSIRKDVKVTERVGLEFQGIFTNVLNHAQQLDPVGIALYSESSFGSLEGQTNPTGAWMPRAIELGGRVRF
jgi:hypothetical protein